MGIFVIVAWKGWRYGNENNDDNNNDKKKTAEQQYLSIVWMPMMKGCTSGFGGQQNLQRVWALSGVPSLNVKWYSGLMALPWVITEVGEGAGVQHHTHSGAEEREGKKKENKSRFLDFGLVFCLSFSDSACIYAPWATAASNYCAPMWAFGSGSAEAPEQFPSVVVRRMCTYFTVKDKLQIAKLDEERRGGGGGDISWWQRRDELMPQLCYITSPSLILIE